MRRREFMTLLGGAAASSPLWPLAARAQQPRRIGALIGLNKDDPESQPRVSAFLARLKKLGWEDGRNLNVEIRFSGSDPDLTRSYAKELLALAPDVILTQSNLTTTSMLRETRAIPVVFAIVADPIGSGYIKAFARPGGNATGFTSYEASVAGKWLELLKEVAPQVKHAAMVMHLETKANVELLGAANTVSASLGVPLAATGVHDAADIERAIDAFARVPNGGIIVLPSPITNAHRDLIVQLAARHRLPAVYAFRYFATGGGLMSYGIDVVDVFERAAEYVARILRGAKPEDLPAQQPTKFELVINLKTAKALGLAVSPMLLSRADEVIE